MEQDCELQDVLRNYNVDPTEVYRVFTREVPLKFTNLVSSDLDADRIDYLLRTAHHAGLPYGSVDLDYLLSQVRIDKNGKICITSKALRTADHFLLSRYFDYQQVPFHKTVASLELILKEVLAELLRQGYIDCSASEVTQMIRDGTWYEFDDTLLLQKIRQLSVEAADEVCRLKASAILQRTPPKLLAATERIDRRDEINQFKGQKQQVKSQIAAWASKFDIPEELWDIWEVEGMTLTKIGSNVPSSSLVQEPREGIEDLVQSVHVLNSTDDNSIPITDIKRSLMSVLADYALYSLRIYVLLPNGMEHKVKNISDTIRSDLPYIDWV